MNNTVNCWKPLRAMNTTTQPETANVTVEKIMDWAISSQASEMGKVQRLGSNPVGSERNRSAVPCYAGEDIARSASKDAEDDWKRVIRNTQARGR